MTARPGKTLLELLVALGLLAVLLGALLGALASDARSHLALAARAETRAQLQAGAFAIARDLRSAPWRSKLHYVWREPGWSHDGSRETSDTIRARWEQQEKAGT